MGSYKMLVPVDFSDPSLEALEQALFLAGKLHGKVVLLNVMPADETMVDEQLLARDLKAFYDDRLNLLRDPSSRLRASEPRVLIRRGEPVDQILAVAREELPDMIVIGTYGRRDPGSTRLGAVAERVAREARCPVLTCRTAFAAAV